MKKILVMDEKNYDESMEEIYRVSVRGIIFVDNKLLLIQSDFGEVKFPGGGQEHGENDMETLVRETLEETGYHIIPDSVRAFGEVEEKRLSTKEPKIWHQINRYYFCDVGDVQEECHYTANERKYGFHQVWYSLEDAIRVNEEMLNREGILPWNQREYNVLKLIKQVRATRNLQVIEPVLSVCKVLDYSQVNWKDYYVFIGKTDEEKSLVCSASDVPANIITRDDGWRALRIAGVLDFSLIGILAEITKILADSEIGIFAISTYNTDYILTREENFAKAIEVLTASGYQIGEEG